MKFFYRYINRLKEPDSVSADIDPAMLGNILHDIMKNLYTPYTGSELSSELLGQVIKNRQFLTSLVDQAVIENYKAGRHDFVSGNELIVRDVLMVYLGKILNSDKALAPFMILNLEETFKFDLLFSLKGSLGQISTGRQYRPY